MNEIKHLSYWKWFFRGYGSRPGFRRVINKWLIIHILIGILIAFSVSKQLQEISNAVLLPLFGIIIGLSFAWAGNAQALMQSPEIEKLSEYRDGGFLEYVYTYQTAILVILVTLVLWSIAGLSIIDDIFSNKTNGLPYFFVKGFLFTLCSLTIRESWHVVIGVQWMLITQKNIKDSNANRKKI